MALRRDSRESRETGEYGMKQHAVLVVTSLLSILGARTVESATGPAEVVRASMPLVVVALPD
jgi:hypothetical protein